MHKGTDKLKVKRTDKSFLAMFLWHLAGCLPNYSVYIHQLYLKNIQHMGLIRWNPNEYRAVYIIT